MNEQQQQIKEKCACIYYLVGYIKSGVPFSPLILAAARSAFIAICSELITLCGGLNGFLGVFYDGLLLGNPQSFEAVSPEQLKASLLSIAEG